MRQTLFHIPAEVFGIPTLGFGWLLAVWALVSVLFSWSSFRQDGVVRGLFGLAMYLLLGFVVIGFALPNLEEQVADAAGKSQNLGLPVRGYGVSMFIAVSSGVALAIYRGVRRGLDADRITSLAVWLFVAGILGARLFFLFQYRNEFTGATLIERLGKAINIAEGGLVVYGSLIGALLAYTLFVWRHRLPPLMIADLLAPSMLLGLAIGRIGCLMNGCCYGAPGDHAWSLQFPKNSPPYMEQLERGLQHGIYWSAAGSEEQPSEQQTEQSRRFRVGFVDANSPAAIAGLKPKMELSLKDARALAYAKPQEAVSISATAEGTSQAFNWNAGMAPARSLPTHPTQLYSSLNAFLLCGFILAIGPFVKRDGTLLAITLMTYPVTRFLLEIVRIDEPSLNQFGWTISQSVSIAIFLVGLGLALYVRRQPVGKLHARAVVG